MATPKKVITQAGKPVSMFSLRQRTREATQEPFTFDVDGEYFTMASPAEADWQVTAGLSTGDSNLRDFVRELLGDDYERFCKIEGVSSDDISALIEAASQHYQGVGRGE
ncbi:hypothetical protein E1286_05215 [Nonomuraea terrae]|uniref:Uncharacterized protein n=1 Tax=Nonomuraea terrae TaxID=2530383 RepID=A0A4R4ZA26_9ACTN|nr:hypothetical protein [Nonomuraea terrae]TDD54590.1 hypothetical protein E1286_05215 [Nonomuraea terrae]